MGAAKSSEVLMNVAFLIMVLGAALYMAVS